MGAPSEPALPLDAPLGLAEAIDRHDAHVTAVRRGKRQHPHRTYLELASPQGGLHGLYSRDPADERIVAHEVAARAVVGSEGPLRAPPMLASGQLWMLGVAALRRPTAGGDIEAVAAAAERLAGLRLPPGPHRGRDVSLSTLWARRLRLLRSPLPLRDLLEARRALSACSLPQVTGHGYFHPVHVFPDGGAAWVIDWELSGPLPVGWDLLNYWTGVTDPQNRAAIFAAASELAGRGSGRELRRLRYALLVRAVAAHLMDDSDRAEARRLLGLLPETRAKARV